MKGGSFLRNSPVWVDNWRFGKFVNKATFAKILGWQSTID